MNRTTLSQLVANKYILGAIGLLVVVGGVWVFYARSTPSFGPTLTIHRADFNQQIEVSGTVQAAQDVDLGFAQSGRISGVYALVGQMVPAGATLAQIENGDLRAAVSQKEAALQAAQATLASLQSGTRPETIAITQTQITNDQTALAQAKQAVVNALKSAYTESDDAVHNKVDQFFSNPLSSSPTLLFVTANSQLQATLINERVAIEPVLHQWQSEVNALSTTATDLSGAESVAETNLTQVSQLLSDGNAALNVAPPSQSASQTTLNGYISSVATARANINAAQSTLTSAITSDQNAQAALSEDQKNLALQQAGSTPDSINEQEAQVAAAQADLQNAQAQLQETIVTAPFAGVVTRMDAKVGQIVSPNSPEISMISNGLFQIVSYVPEVEISGLTVGNSASSTLDAYGPDTYFAAQVIAIDPAETVVNGVSTYKTTLQFLAADPRIKSGMTATVDITTASVPDAIAIPEGAVFQKNGQQMVQVIRAKVAVDTPVEVAGNSSFGDIQITQGLQEGDVILLDPNIAL